MSGQLAGLGSALRLGLHRDRVRLPLWVLGVTAFTAYCSEALLLAAPHPGDLKVMTSLMSGAAGVVLVGPGYGFTDPTHEAVFAGGYGLYIAILAACMSILLVTRHTRAEEEVGRLELLRALPLARQSSAASVLCIMLLANLLTAALCWAVLIPRFDLRSSLLFALGVAATGMFFGAVALVTAQLGSASRTTNEIAFVVLGIAFVLRGIGDVLGITTATQEVRGSWLSWLSPLAWPGQTRVFVEDRWWPLLCSVVGAAALIALAAWLQSRRDVGAGLIAAREGKAEAGQLLAGPFALALRSQRVSLIVWIIAGVAIGGSFGALAKGVGESLGKSSDPIILLALGGDPHRLIDGYLGITLLFGVVLASCFAILSVQRLAHEEHSGRAELLLALPLGRARWGIATLATAVFGAICILLATGVTAGIASAIVQHDTAEVARLADAAMMYVLPVAVIACIAFLGFALRPSLIWLGWVVFGYGMFVSMLGGMLKLPNVVSQLSVFHHAGQPPFSWGRPGAMMLLGAAALLLILLANIRLSRRNLLG